MTGKKNRTIEEVILDNNPLEKELLELAEDVRRERFEITSEAE